MSNLRKCASCGVEFKPLTSAKSCSKECSILARRKKQAEQYYGNHEVRKKVSSKLSKLRRDKDPLKALLHSAKNRAKVRGLPFNLERDLIEIPNLCPVLGTEFQLCTEYAMSIDRIDSSKGYTKDNIQVISKKANAMKSNATKEELIAFADWIYKNYKTT